MIGETRPGTPSRIDALAARLASVPQLPADHPAREAARQRIADTVVSLLAGTTTVEGSALRDAVGALSGSGRPGSADLITFLCGSARVSETDDIHVGSCTTVGSVVVPVALAAAAARPEVSGGRLVEAVVAGYEAMIALGVAIDGANRVYSGIWPTIITAPFGAAAATAIALGLDAEHIADALATALTRSGGLAGKSATDLTSRWFTVGRAASDGYASAVAASRGLQGDSLLLDKGFGPATGTTVADEPFRDRCTWSVGDVDVKPYRAQRQSLSCVEAYRAALGTRGVSEVGSVRVWAPKQYATGIDYDTPPHRRNTPGVQYMLALASLYPGSLSDVNRTPVHDTAEVRDLMSRVRIHTDDRLTGLYPAVWGGRADIEWRDGTTSAAEVLHPLGSAGNPMSWAQLEEKNEAVMDAGDVAAKCAATQVHVGSGWVRAVFAAARGLDDGAGQRPGAGPLTGLIAMLRDSVGAPGPA